MLDGTPLKRQRRESEPERYQILAEIQKLEEEIAGLMRQFDQEKEKKGELFLEEGDEEDEEDDIEALEAMLKEMDDGAL